MVGVTVALFFLPLVNGLIGGFVGGYKTGGVVRALLAAILPSLVVSAALWAIFALLAGPGWGLLAGMTTGMLVAFADVGIFIGAALGGLWRARRGPEPRLGE